MKAPASIVELKASAHAASEGSSAWAWTMFETSVGGARAVRSRSRATYSSAERALDAADRAAAKAGFKRRTATETSALYFRPAFRSRRARSVAS